MRNPAEATAGPKLWENKKGQRIEQHKSDLVLAFLPSASTKYSGGARAFRIESKYLGWGEVEGWQRPETKL